LQFRGSATIAGVRSDAIGKDSEVWSGRGGIIARALVGVLVLLLLTPVLSAQMDTGAGGTCELLVRVRTSGEGSVETPVQVDLLGPQGRLATVHILGGEPARFHVNNGRTYQLTVSGNGIETVTTSFFGINALEMSHTETVHVKPQEDPLEGALTPGSNTISVSEMNIPKKASGELNKGMEAYAKGDMETATGHFEKAVAEYPRYARAYDMLGAIAIKGADRGKARELFAKSIRADDSFVPAYVDLARMDLQDQHYADAELLLAKAIALKPFQPDAVALLASTEFANKEYDKALADVQRTHELRNHEQFAEVHVMAGKVLSAQNHPEAAIAQFQLFLTEKPDSPEAESVRRAIAALQAGRQP
jgi:Tfp pilus assembly protein PilF